MNQYIITDRLTATKYAITISDSQIKFDTTASTASVEPVIQDGVNVSDKWKLFIYDGQIGIEATTDPLTTYLDLEDSISAETYRVIVNDGQLGIQTLGTFLIIATVIDQEYLALVDTTAQLLKQAFNNTEYLDQVFTDKSYLKQTFTNQEYLAEALTTVGGK